MKSMYVPTVWTNTPRSPELPPEARQSYLNTGRGNLKIGRAGS
jgi:hypothetical protein